MFLTFINLCMLNNKIYWSQNVQNCHVKLNQISCFCKLSFLQWFITVIMHTLISWTWLTCVIGLINIFARGKALSYIFRTKNAFPPAIGLKMCSSDLPCNFMFPQIFREKISHYETILAVSHEIILFLRRNFEGVSTSQETEDRARAPAPVTRAFSRFFRGW